MKKLLLLVILGCAALNIWGAKAYTEPIRVRQSDGTWITVYLHGDEDFSWYTDSLGRVLERHGNDFKLANTSNQQMMQRIRQVKESRLLTRASIGTATPAYFPHSGSPKALVILVEFQDSVFSLTDPKKSFEQYLNGEGSPVDYDNKESRNYGSVWQYFNDMSGRQFRPQFDLVGPVKVSQNLSYYGADSGGSHDVKSAEMIKEACQLADDSVNYADYDSDGDGYVDLVYIIYAGYSQSMGASTDAIWPKSGTTASFTLDGKKISRYGLNNELIGLPGSFSTEPYKRINGIGLFCHEFSHTLGLPDLYSNLAVDNQEMEYWDLMDGGEYTDNGWTPTPYTPWEKEVMGWTTLTAITDAQTYTLLPDKALKVEGEDDEYIILHNIQKTGWASKLLGHGMLVYRIDYPTGSNNVNLGDFPNGTSGKPGITIVPADGLLISSYRVYASGGSATTEKPYRRAQYLASHKGDPYPGTSEVTEIESITLNNSVLYKPIYNITETNGTITFDFLEKTPSGISEQVLPDQPTDGSIYSIDGIYMGRDLDRLPKGLYIRNGKKIIKQ